MARSIMGCCLVVLGFAVATGLPGASDAAGQRKGVPQKSFATPEKAARALEAAYQ
jgi:hypothetical protein